MLEAPRELLALALALLEEPPKALVFLEELLLETCRLPILFPPPPLRFALVLLRPTAEFELARFVEGAFRSLGVLLLALDCCLLYVPCCCRALACRLDMESPRAVPPYLFAVALFE
jgi:hypothetical protein